MLNITADLIHELHGYHRPAGITLTVNGWEVRPDERCEAGLTPITSESMAAWLDGTDLDEVALDALVQPDGPGAPASYAIPDENGRYDVTHDGAWQIVIPEVSFDDPEPAWAGAYWVQLDDLEEVVEAPEALDYDDHGQLITRHRRTGLWRTAGARWITQTESDYVDEDSVMWTPITDVEAMEFIHAADPGRINSKVCTVWTSAASVARAITEAFGGKGTDQRTLDLREASDMFRASRALTELLRNTVLSDLREGRHGVASRVFALSEWDYDAAAAVLGLSPTSLRNLLAQ